jgi:copper(I)-binding protein
MSSHLFTNPLLRVPLSAHILVSEFAGPGYHVMLAEFKTGMQTKQEDNNGYRGQA